MINIRMKNYRSENNFMNKVAQFCAIAILALCLGLLTTENLKAQSIFPSLGTDRSGTAGFQFTKIDIDPRSAGMGHSAMADISGGAALYWNPAMAVYGKNNELFVSHSNYVADINMEYMSYVHQFKKLTLGASLQYLDSGEMNETTETQQFGTGRTFRTLHMAAGITAAQQVTDLFSYGFSLKYLAERIENVDLNSAAVDLGFFYKVGDTGLRFAVSLINFGFDSKPSGYTEHVVDGSVVREESFADVTLPTTFNIGTALDVLKGGDHTLTLTGQIQNPSDNAERFSVGGEYGFKQIFFLRTGYRLGVDEAKWPTFGAGFKLPYAKDKKVSVDVALAQLERLGATQRISLKLDL